jgi:hypothetical protein
MILILTVAHMEMWGSPLAIVVADGSQQTVPVRIYGLVLWDDGAIQERWYS